MKVNVKVMRLDERAIVPKFATSGSAGGDIYAVHSDIVYPGTIKVVKTGFAMALPEGYEAQIRPRSGLASKGITVANSPGTVDADYRGEVGVLIRNETDDLFVVEPGMRIAQMVIKETVTVTFNVVENLNDTERGEGGWGSTGV